MRDPKRDPFTRIETRDSTLSVIRAQSSSRKGTQAMRFILLGAGCVRPDLEHWGPSQIVQVGDENLIAWAKTS